MSIRNFKKEPGYDYRIINNVVDLYSNKPTEKTTNRINQLKKDGFSVVEQAVRTGINQDIIIMRKPVKKVEKQSEKKEPISVDKSKVIPKTTKEAKK